MSSGTPPRTSRSTRRRRAEPRIRSRQPPSPKTSIFCWFSYGFPPGPVATRTTGGFQPPRPHSCLQLSLHLCSLHRFPSASPRAGPGGPRTSGLGLGLGAGALGLATCHRRKRYYRKVSDLATKTQFCRIRDGLRPLPPTPKNTSGLTTLLDPRLVEPS